MLPASVEETEAFQFNDTGDKLGLEGVVTNSMGTAHIVYSVLFVAWPATNIGQHAISLNDGPSGKRSSHGLTVSPSPPRHVGGAARSPHVSEDHVAAAEKRGRTQAAGKGKRDLKVRAPV